MTERRPVVGVVEHRSSDICPDVVGGVRDPYETGVESQQSHSDEEGWQQADGSPRVEPHQLDAAGLLVLGGQHHCDQETTEDEEPPSAAHAPGMVVKLEW